MKAVAVAVAVVRHCGWRATAPPDSPPRLLARPHHCRPTRSVPDLRLRPSGMRAGLHDADATSCGSGSMLLHPLGGRCRRRRSKPHTPRFARSRGAAQEPKVPVPVPVPVPVLLVLVPVPLPVPVPALAGLAPHRRLLGCRWRR